MKKNISNINLIMFFLALSFFDFQIKALAVTQADSETEHKKIDFKVVALFKNAVMIQHDGKQKMLRSGQSYLNKIKLLTADSHKANFLIDGKQISLGLHQSKLGGALIFSDNTSEKKSILISVDNSGMFRTVGTINGVQVNFLVDTGASQVAMSESTARLIGLQYKLKGHKGIVETASGRNSAWFLKLKKVNVKGLELKQVEGLVVQGTGPNEVLLGMSFLRQLKMNHNGSLLRLKKKY